MSTMVVSIPKVSVVMPIFNGERHLAEAIKSVLAQSLTNFELICVTEYGTSPQSSEIVTSFSQDSRVRVLANTERLGLSASLNRGIREAKGEFIARMDSDDLCHPDRLLKQVAYLVSHPEISLCGSDVEVFGAQDDLWIFHRDPKVIAAQLLFNSAFAHPSVMWRKADFEKFALQYDETRSQAEDWELWLRASRHLNLASIPEVLLRYRVHEASATARGTQALIRENEVLMSRTLAEVGLNSPEDIQFCSYLSAEMIPGTVPSGVGDVLDWELKLMTANEQTRRFDSTALRKVLAQKNLKIIYKEPRRITQIAKACLVRPARLFRLSWFTALTYGLSKCRMKLFRKVSYG